MTTMTPTPSQVCCGHPENHCGTCGKHWPVTTLARDCEAKHEREDAAR